MTMIRTASENLFSRPDEEHHPSFSSLLSGASAQRQRCAEHDAKETTILFAEDGNAVHFGDQTLRLTNYSMAQLAAMARVPMPVLERLDGPTRARVLNQTFPRQRRYRVALVDGDRLRCVTSDRYERVWDADLLEEVDRWLLPSGFVPAMPTINTDEYGTNLMGNTKPALFRSDRDMFAFFYSDQEPGDDGFGGLRKGVMVFNSEVGAKSFGFSTFYFREMCANFLIWDATGVKSRRVRHMGTVKEVVREFHEDLVRIGTTITTAEYDVFQRAKETRFVREGPNEEELAVKRLNREFKLSEADAREVVALVREPENPGDLSVWGVVNGITSAAKAYAHAEHRSRISNLAGRILETASI
jgi:hypothetical protein